MGDDEVVADVAARYARLAALWRQARNGVDGAATSPPPLAAKDTA